MTFGQFRYALGAARRGWVVSDTGASGRMDELLIDVAASVPGARGRIEAVKAARRQYRAERRRRA